ncbi:MAG: hypothetical protein ACLR4Z_04360 [Butyricicoccaceae bacterium]
MPLTAAVDGTEVAIASVDYDAGTVALASAPAERTGDATTSALPSSKTVPGAADTINRCRIAGLYGGKNDTRVFLAGNPDEPHCDWQSGLYDPTYFPDTGFARMGTEASAIAGYLKQYESQIIVKTGGAQGGDELRAHLRHDRGRHILLHPAAGRTRRGRCRAAHLRRC